MGNSQVALLKTEGIRAGYRELPVIRDINISLQEGKVYALIGPNGSGKTTFFRVIAGMLKPFSGELSWKGKNIEAFSARERARLISYLPQRLPSFLPFPVEEVVAMGRWPHIGRFQPLQDRDREIVERVMEWMEITHFRSSRLSELSGGELQRVFLAQALVQEPRLLLMDEPVSHLDIAHQIKILDLIKKIKGEGITIFLILHDLNLASEYSDHIFLLHQGSIHKEGKPEEVLTYENLEKVYQTVLIVKDNPFTGRPHTYIIPEEKREIR